VEAKTQQQMEVQAQTRMRIEEVGRQHAQKLQVAELMHQRLETRVVGAEQRAFHDREALHVAVEHVDQMKGRVLSLVDGAQQLFSESQAGDTSSMAASASKSTPPRTAVVEPVMVGPAAAAARVRRASPSPPAGTTMLGEQAAEAAEHQRRTAGSARGSHSPPRSAERPSSCSGQGPLDRSTPSSVLHLVEQRELSTASEVCLQAESGSGAIAPVGAGAPLVPLPAVRAFPPSYLDARLHRSSSGAGLRPAEGHSSTPAEVALARTEQRAGVEGAVVVRPFANHRAANDAGLCGLR